MTEAFNKVKEVVSKSIEKLSEASEQIKAKVEQLDKPLNEEVEKNENGFESKDSINNLDKPLNDEGVTGKGFPENNGRWEGEPGNSKWIPDADYIPPGKSRNPDNPFQYNNPDKLSMGEIMKKYGIDGIVFKDGYPDFEPVSKGKVTIDGFETGGSDAKDRNFRKADIEFANQNGRTPMEAKKFRKENNLTWHELEDKSTMLLVPNEIHANIPHQGGRSQK